MHPTLAGLYPFLLGSPARCTFLLYFMFIYILGSPARSRLSRYRSCPNIRKGSPRGLIPANSWSTIVVFCSSDSDSADSVYSSALDLSSALPKTIFSDQDLLHSMEGEQLATLEQALAELQAKEANTQHKLDILISHIPQSKNPIPSTQIPPVTPKAHGLKPALPLEFDRDRTKGMAFLNSCQVYICLCLNSFTDEQAKIVWAMSYIKAG